MIFTETPLQGAYLIDLERREDERGFLSRSFCEREFLAHGLETRWVQMNTSFTHRRGTVRGMHFQRPPHAEVKVVRCVRGAVQDVVVDLRAGSATLGQWFGIELDAKNRRMLYIPTGLAHGFQTLCDDTELLYQHSAFYAPGGEGGLRYDDAQIGIAWPLPPIAVSNRDRNLPAFSVSEALPS